MPTPSPITKTCTACDQPFTITAQDQQFYQDVAPTFNGKKYPIPLPDICPTDRRRQRLSYRNLRKLYHRKCDLTGKKLLSCYDTDTVQPVYNADEWWSDKWDPLDYGKEYDFNRPFFEQFKELYKKVPVLHQYAVQNENCEYVNGVAKSKDCYLTFNADFCEKCYYVTDAVNTNSTLDSYGIMESELCYECVDCDNCYNLQYSINCSSCTDSYFLADCKRVKNCIACCNLVDKEYYIFNKKVTPQEFNKVKESLRSRQGVMQLRQKFQEFSLQFPKKYYNGYSIENASGNNIRNAKDSHECFQSFDLENCQYCYYVVNANNCMDYDIFGDNSQWIYNCIATGYNCSNNIGCVGAWNGSSNNAYCTLLSGSSNNFGCCSLRQKQYCILNRQYTKEEYEQLVPRIIEHMQKTGEWGKFFPQQMSPYGYNETVAHEFYPLTKEQAQKQNFRWKELKETIPKTENPTPASQLPDTINDITDDILKQAIECEVSKRPFKIIPQELAFYKKHGIPLPTKHPEVRHEDRAAQKLPMLLWDRKCAKCATAIRTSYAPARTETIYCEKCYLDEVY